MHTFPVYLTFGQCAAVKEIILAFSKRHHHSAVHLHKVALLAIAERAITEAERIHNAELRGGARR